MTPQQFIAKWGAPGGVPGPAYALNEEQGAQSHFLDWCELLAVPKPGRFGADDIAWFNSSLFRRVDVPELTILDVTELRNAASLNWSAIDMSIFGTLFERGLDPAKRSQLGAHYTDPATIDRIIEPLLRRSLPQKWKLVAHEIPAPQASACDAAFQRAQALFYGWLDELKNFRVLDPACGSGNFLFMGLKAHKDIEHQSHLDASALGLDREADLVTGPHNVLGIELNGYAAELARVTVWIGELQWRMAHGYEFKCNPVLEPLEHIECRDALLSFVESGESVEAPWPQANVVIGNPPFLGGSKKRRELGDDYFAALNTVFAGRVPGGADLACYWFDKARQQIQSGQLESAGLVATQAIRAGANRTVLERLLQKSDLEHNSVHGNHHIRHTSTGGTTALGGDSTGSGRARGESDRQEPGQPGNFGSLRCQAREFPGTVTHRSGRPQVDDGPDDRRGDVPGAQHTAQPLSQNSSAAFQGPMKVGAFDIPGAVARGWLCQPNVNGKSNALVLRPWANGQHIAQAQPARVDTQGTRSHAAGLRQITLPRPH